MAPVGFLNRDLTRADHDHLLWLDYYAVARSPECSLRIGAQAERRQKAVRRNLRGVKVLHLKMLQLDAWPGRTFGIVNRIAARNHWDDLLPCAVIKLYPVACHRHLRRPAPVSAC